MHHTLKVVALIAASLGTMSAHAQQWGDLKVKFVLKGKAPAAKKIDVTRDQNFCGKHNLVEESLVVGKNGGVQNVLIYAYEDRGGIELPAIHPDAKGKSRTLTLANKGCRFEPHMIICQVGDTLKVTNPDAVGHNANLSFINNTPQNFTIPPNGEKEVKLETDEPAPIPVECNIHPWMKAHIVVTKNAYAASSNAEGELVIKNLPVGKVALRVYHEGARRLAGLKIGGAELSRRNVIELDIKSGMNDLGTVELDASLFES